MEKDNSKVLKELQKQLDACQKQNLELQKQVGKATTDLEIEKCRRKEAELDAEIAKKTNVNNVNEALVATTIGFLATMAFFKWWNN